MNNQIIPQNIIEKMISDRSVRISITRQSHYLFFHFYFAHYIKYKTAPFQKELFKLTEDDSIKNLYCCAFRGSGKSTIFTTSYPIWAILGIQQKKFVLILSQTQAQAKQYMVNLRCELESNDLLKKDLGPFQEETNEWGSSSLVFSNTNARITVASSEQSVRGLRHGQYRPDLIIGDDVENMASTKTKEGREKTYAWLKGEIIPTGDKNTKLVIVGNLLHEDSLLMHLKRDVEEGILDGVFKIYPLLDKNGRSLWHGKYPTNKDIEAEKKRIGNEKAWRREYLLEIIPDDDQIIVRDNIQYYSQLPSERARQIIIGVDLAISQKTSADKTAAVTIAIYGRGSSFCAYVLPNTINERMGFKQMLDRVETLYDNIQTIGRISLYVEDVGYQRSAIEQLNADGYPAKPYHVHSDKYARLASVSHLIVSGEILFPQNGTRDLVDQIVGFGKERYDDLVDAFTIAAHESMKLNKRGMRVFSRDSETYASLRQIGF